MKKAKEKRKIWKPSHNNVGYEAMTAGSITVRFGMEKTITKRVVERERKNGRDR
jgi:hypothetical protein